MLLSRQSATFYGVRIQARFGADIGEQPVAFAAKIDIQFFQHRGGRRILPHLPDVRARCYVLPVETMGAVGLELVLKRQGVMVMSRRDCPSASESNVENITGCFWRGSIARTSSETGVSMQFVVK